MRLQTQRLILREWISTDVDDLVEGLNDLRVSKWLARVPYPYTKKHAEQWIRFCMQDAGERTKRNAYHFAIDLKSEKKLIGGVSLEGIDKIQGTAGGGIWINARYQGQGYGTEAFGARIRFAFEKLNLRRLENGYLKGNSSSLRMQQKYGYKAEGIRRQAFRCMADGKIKDEYMMGLLKEGWERKIGKEIRK
jgi:[ribosomal protein S5]-alanine N-acetyltransferase